MLFIRAYSCIPLMMFWVNYSEAFDAHVHMETLKKKKEKKKEKKNHINFALQQLLPR